MAATKKDKPRKDKAAGSQAAKASTGETMTADGGVGTKGRRKKRKNRDGDVPRPDDDVRLTDGHADANGHAAAAVATGRADRRRNRRGVHEPVPVKSRVAAGRIRGIAAVSDSLEVRGRLRRLAGQIAHGSRNAQGISFVETEIAECLDEAATAAVPRERWLLCEAATWGLAWLARTRRAGGSAGGLLERLVKAARSAQPALADRDTLPARFVLLLARLFSDIEACRCLERATTTALEEEIGRLVSTEGVVGLTGSPAAVERAARWAGIREVALATGGPAWDGATEERMQAAAAASLRLLGGNGRVLRGAGRLPAAFSASLLAVAAESSSKPVRRTAAAIENHGTGRRRKLHGRTGKRPRSKLLPRDLHDPRAAVAIIRSGWDRDDLRVLLDYRDATPRLEIAAGDRLLVDGAWQWRVEVDGRPLEAEGPWSVSGWESDRKASFLEIVAPLAGGLQIERQVVVVPADRILLLADAVTRRPDGAHATTNGHARHGGSATEAGHPAYESAIPLAATLEADRAEDTREIMTYDTALRFAALPLALPEWMASAGRGTLAVDSDTNRIVLRQQATGPRLYAPLWLDCDPGRLGEPLTWRQLTVADTRQNLAPHEAAGFRVQVGMDQWLLYRALDAPRNRSVLGCNLSCEFLLGRVGRKGIVSRTIEIQ
jgi:hypothetical protein